MFDFNEYNFLDSNPFKDIINISYHEYRPNWSWQRNLPHASLYIIADGTLHFILDDCDFIAQQNDVVFLDKNVQAVISNDSDTKSTLYYIAFQYDEKFDLCIKRLTKNTSYLAYFKDALNSHLSQAPYSKLRVAGIFYRLIYHLCLNSLKDSEDYKSNSKITMAAEYININYYKNITVDELCQMTAYSPSHFRRLFIKNYGVSPQSYILDKKIEMAKEMLLDVHERSIAEISNMIGICSCSYFCKIFKLKTGMSPKEYKLSKML